MRRPELPPLDLNLTPSERSQAAVWQCDLERQRRDRNREDARREKRPHCKPEKQRGRVRG